jgi:hypothetical protein
LTVAEILASARCHNRTALTLAVAGGLALAACVSSNRGSSQPSDDLHDLLGTIVDYQIRPVALVRHAPIVIVGVVAANEALGPPREARRIQGVGVQLRRATIDVELVLRGGEIQPRTSVHYFAQSYTSNLGGNPLHKTLLSAEVGRRYVFFLLPEKGHYRSVGDVGNYTIEVFSGRHTDRATEALGAKAPLGHKVAWLLLTPGEGLDSRRFADNIDRARSTADLVGSRQLTVSLLEKLRGKDRRLDAAVCFELVRSFYGHSACLQTIATDPHQPQAIRDHAKQRIETASITEESLLRELRSGSGLGFGAMTYPDSYAANRQELELLLQHPNEEVRRRAGVLLRHCYSSE